MGFTGLAVSRRAGAHKSLERAYRRDIVRVLWTPAGFLRTLRVCRLYDYGCHRWIDYDGTPLSEPLLPPPPAPEPVPAAPAEAVAPLARATEHQEGKGQPNQSRRQSGPA